MLKLKQIAAGLFGMLVLAGGATKALAGPIFLTPSSGGNTKIIYSNAQTDNGLYGQASLSGTTFLFSNPHDFLATASGSGGNPAAQTTTDRLSIIVSSADGTDLKRVSVHEFGDWSILNSGTVKATGGLFLFSHDTATFGQEFDATPVVSYKDTEHGSTFNSPNRPTADGSGTWMGDFTFLLPNGVKSVEFVLNNVLQASAPSGSTALIQKKGISITFQAPAPAVPEPASLALLFGGSAMLVRRRRSA